jgi:aspartate/glutamate racemase
MKTIGLLGGITCESSLVYYKLINEMTREKLGGLLLCANTASKRSFPARRCASGSTASSSTS